jgi:hypothetical protein
MSGAKLFLLFAWPANKLGLCGSTNSALRKKIKAFLEGRGKLSSKELMNFARTFSAAFPYLKLIAQVNKITNPLAEKVVEAYWIGNGLLRKVKNDDLSKMIERKRGKILSFSQRIYVHHSFHVFGMEPLNPELKMTLAFQKICTPRWGRIVKIEKGNVWVKIEPLLPLGEKRAYEQKWSFNPIIFPSLKKRQLVVGHLKELVSLLTLKQRENLKFFTQYNLKILYEKNKT